MQQQPDTDFPLTAFPVENEFALVLFISNPQITPSDTH